MIVLLTCTPSLKKILPGFVIEMRSIEAFVTLVLVLWTRTLWLWTEMPFRAGPVLSMSALSAKGIGCMDWPDPPFMLI